MISIFSVLVVVIVLLRRSGFPYLYGFAIDLQAHDLIRAAVKFHQRLAFILLELIPKGGLRSYLGDCYHHHSILLWVMYRGQLVIETLYV